MRTCKMVTKTRKAFFMKQLNIKVHTKLNKIAKETGISKWLIAEAVLENSLNVKGKSNVDLSKYLKAK